MLRGIELVENLNKKILFRPKCYFMVWSPIGYHLEIINYDDEFWNEVEETLENFYMNCLLPEIVDPRAPRGLPIREPDYIVQVEVEFQISKSTFLSLLLGTKLQKPQDMTISLYEYCKGARQIDYGSMEYFEKEERKKKEAQKQDKRTRVSEYQEYYL